MSPISRRQFLAAAAMAPLALMSEKGAGEPAASKPNIVFILADDLGYADLSCYGRPDFETPNLDHLANEGIRFLQAYSNSPVCTASRTAIITGRYQYRLPVGLEEPLAGPARNIGLPAQHPTLPSLLKKAGYSTALIGKWHLGWPPDYSPLKSGYDHFWGFRGGALDYFTHKDGVGQNGNEDLWDDDAEIHEVGYLTDLLGAKAVDLIGRYSKKPNPFFISLHFNAPHWPWEGPADEAEAQRIKTLYHIDGGSQKIYAAMVRQMDLQIGRVLDALRNNKADSNTIVIFTSDNGGERFSDTWPFTGKKTELLEGGLRIPVLVRWPRHIRPGSTTDQVAMGMDWLPTLLRAAGTQPDPGHPTDGMSLLPALSGNAQPVPRTVFWRYRFNQQRALRDGDIKWLKIAENTFLFNVVEDPLERANLKDRQPDLYKKVVDQYDAWNATMLPEDPKATSAAFDASVLADHFGNHAQRPRE
jgi:arylsulfatase A-like enzyme